MNKEEKKMILYGYGKYAKEKMDDELMSSLELIIDNGLQNGESVNGIPIVTWKEYIQSHEHFKSNRIVIGAGMSKELLYAQVLRSGLFQRFNITTIDRYLYEKRSKVAGEIRSDLLNDARLLSNREAALRCIEKGIVAAEVGVAWGDFSYKILETIMPSKFYAIDIFSLSGFWGETKFSEEYTHEDWYRDKFRGYVEKGVLETRKGLSWNVLKAMEDNSLDYLYLDAGHDYDSVKKDIKEAARVVKNNGIIQFNDYTVYDYCHLAYYGIVPCVNEYVNNTGSKVLFYCLSEHGFDDIVVKNRK